MAYHYDLLIKTWALRCYTLLMTSNFIFSYHASIWFSISHYYLYQFQI
jgi:hypothetical protein